uniref:GRIP domain-containing protein n=1 Tax=Heterorhabditis bacteriophora TaxID=37862 RepID=A0A1I7XJU4_HETBA
MSWLRSLQGQLSELASEVLNEATEEVADPESELQVANKKCAEAERQLVLEQSKVSTLENKNHELNQQLYAAHVEMDAIGTKYGTMVQTRDDEIKKLNIELEHLRSSCWDEHDGTSKSMWQEISDLQKEVSHWKGIVNESQMGAASSSASNVDLLDAVLLEKEELIETKRKLEELRKWVNLYQVKRKMSEDKPVVLDIVERADASDMEERLRSAEEELSQMRLEATELRQRCKDSETLKLQHEELTVAYNDLNEEFEKFKEEHGSVQNNNQDLTKRIDLLKANLIEYEERYELCKRENAETVRQLEKLSEDFERLRSGFADAREKNNEVDASLNDEVEKLRDALEQSKADRERLREDVERFRSAVTAIDSELDGLRDSNRRLAEENATMSSTIERDIGNFRYDASLKEILSRNERDLSDFREEFEALQEGHSQESVATSIVNNQLKDEIAALRERNRLQEEESRLLIEMNVHLRKKDQGEVEKTALLEEKVRYVLVDLQLISWYYNNSNNIVCSLLEQHQVELQESLRTMEKELNDAKSNERTTADSNGEWEKESWDSASTPVDSYTVGGQQENSTVSCLTEQLREALAANSEKTEECEKLRQTQEELEKELNLSDKEKAFYEMEQQLVHEKELSNERELEIIRIQSLLHQLDDSDDFIGVDISNACLQVEKHIHLKKPSEEVDKELHDADVFTKTPVSENLGLEQSMELMSFHENVTNNAPEMVEMRQRIYELEEQLVEFSNLKKREKCEEELKLKIISVEEANNQLKQVLSQKHSESLEFFHGLETAVARISELQDALNMAECRLTEESQKLENERLENEKCNRELLRLKEHLLLVEETSTAEAVEAEKRETSLRALVRELQITATAANSGANESSQQYEKEISILREQVELGEKLIEEWHSRFEAEHRLRQEACEALNSLQGVVRELSTDHERESAGASHRNLQLQTQIQELTTTLANNRSEAERLLLDKQAAEDLLEEAKNSIEARQRIIDELELQLEEMRAPINKLADGYRIDDATLRQLFLQYFTAPPDKKPDIAMLLASILEYPPEDMEKVRHAAFPDGSSSQRSRTSGPSLMEQFIRFLEVESESSRTAPQLPISPEQTTIRQNNLPAISSEGSAALDPQQYIGSQA